MPAFGTCPILKRWWRVIPGLVMAVTVVRGADQSAPSTLDDIKVDLKAAQRAERSPAGSLSAAPMLSVPGFIPPQDDSASPARPVAGAPNPVAAKKPPNANWLIDALNLQADRKSASSATTAGMEKKSPVTVDFSDPQYMLKLYFEQKADKKENTTRFGREERSFVTPSPDVDTLNGFLRQWISPRDLALLGIDDVSPTGGTDLTRSAILNPGGTGVPPSTVSGVHNPFLDALAVEPGSNITGVAPFVRREPSPDMNSAPLAPRPSAAPEDPKSPGNRGPLPNAAKDEKYFPQLHRF